MDVNVKALVRHALRSPNFINLMVSGLVHLETSKVNGGSVPVVICGMDSFTFCYNGVQMVINISDLTDVSCHTYGSEGQYLTIRLTVPGMTVTYTVSN